MRPQPPIIFSCRSKYGCWCANAAGDVIFCIAVSAVWIKCNIVLPCPALPLPCEACTPLGRACTLEGVCHSLFLLLSQAPHASVAICFLPHAVQNGVELNSRVSAEECSRKE